MKKSSKPAAVSVYHFSIHGEPRAVVLVGYHLMVECDGGHRVDHVEVPAVARRAARFGTGTRPLLTPGVESQTLKSQRTGAFAGHHSQPFSRSVSV